MFDHKHSVFGGHFIYTYTGRKIFANPPTQEDDIGPSLKDIAVQCGRIARFAGATTIWWSTLHHLFVCDRLIVKIYNNLEEHHFNLARLGALLHDAHESITADIPGPFKPDVISSFQNDLDRRIFQEFAIALPLPAPVSACVSTVDEIALHAEGRVVGPPNSDEWALEQDEMVLKAVEDIIHQYSIPSDTISPQGKAVQDYINLVNELLDQIHIKNRAI